MRQYSQIKSWDRVIIAKYRARGLSISDIARALGFNKSSISREVRRNYSWVRSYRHKRAQEFRDARNRTAMAKRRASIGVKTKEWIRQKLEAKWSPEQIAGRSIIDGPQRVSHEYIYRFVAKDRENGGKLYEHLRRGGRRRYRFKSPKNRTKIPNRVDISSRPKVVEKRNRLGDIEGDLIVGRHQLSHIVVSADRVSRLVGLEKVPVKSAQLVSNKLSKLIERNGRGKTLTLDNGLEFSAHKQITAKTGLKVYFAHAYAAWERGTVENMNGLLRQFLPKKTDFRKLTTKHIREIEDALNNRPRKCLGYRTPNERHFHRRP